MTDSEITIAILKDLRSEARSTNRRLEAIDARVQVIESNSTITNARLEVIESNTTITNARFGVIENTLVDMFAARTIKNVERRHDAELDDLRGRVTKLESDE